MKTPIDDRLRDEARRFELRFACEDCIHFEAPEAGRSDAGPDVRRGAATPAVDRGGARCVHGYPLEPRRDALATARAEIIFCKEFELGLPLLVEAAGDNDDTTR